MLGKSTFEANHLRHNYVCEYKVGRVWKICFAASMRLVGANTKELFETRAFQINNIAQASFEIKEYVVSTVGGCTLVRCTLWGFFFPQGICCFVIIVRNGTRGS